MQNVFFAKERRAAEKQIKSQTIDRSGTHMTSTLRWAWGLRQKWNVIGIRGVGRLASAVDVQSFFIKENWICAMNRDHAEPNISKLLTRNLSFDSDVRQWSHPLIIPLHCLWAKSSNITCGQFECDGFFVRLQLNKNKPKESQTRLMSSYKETKADLNEGPDTW